MPNSSTPQQAPTTAQDKAALVARIRDSVIGERDWISSAFGPRPLIYADYIASGRSLTFLESRIWDTVLPIYGNTHTETSYTGREITALREEARATIAKAVGATDEHCVLFCGQGATSAVDRLVRGMMVEEQVKDGHQAVVFVGPYEHHSNDLPWRETGATIERIGLAADGRLDLDHLQSRLAAYDDKYTKIGAFSAASNVTGVRSDLASLAKILHGHGACFVCDFAAAAPYVEMTLALEDNDPQARIDALFFSGHKFIGGPGASGILVADKSLFKSTKPGVTGGGTVSYVTAQDQIYVSHLERREEAGTPNIVADIRAGAVMALKEAVGSQEIEAREEAIIQSVMARLAQDPNIHILGPVDQPRIGVLSFTIEQQGQLLHYGYVVALLNDLFGIQARGGCSCAGPYAHDLLDISTDKSKCYVTAIEDGYSLLRPGWVRLGFNYFFDNQTVDYITEAILFVARYGLHFLQDYEVDSSKAVWKNKHIESSALASLGNFWDQSCPPKTTPCGDISGFLKEARALALQRPAPTLHHNPVFRSDLESLRDFWMPQDIEASKQEQTALELG
nr:aminotransferase class V-fold PLP-dependent enzyme [uncultured Cohaesibacter sp.]